MRKPLCLLLVLAMCLPVCAAAEETFDLTGEWYALRLLPDIGCRLSEAPESVLSLPEAFVSENGLENAATLWLDGSHVLFWTAEGGELRAALAYDTGRGWQGCAGRTNDGLYPDGVYRYDADDFSVQDGVPMATGRYSYGEFPAAYETLGANAYRFDGAITGAVDAQVNLFIRKAWLDSLPDAG